MAKGRVNYTLERVTDAMLATLFQGARVLVERGGQYVAATVVHLPPLTANGARPASLVVCYDDERGARAVPLARLARHDGAFLAPAVEAVVDDII